MHEPDLRVALIYLGAVSVTPILHALLIGVAARWGSRTLWTVWAVGFVLFAVVAWPLTADWRRAAEDTKLFAGIIIGTGVVTAIAAFVVDRQRRAQPALPVWTLAVYSVATAIGVMVVVLVAQC